MLDHAGGFESLAIMYDEGRGGLPQSPSEAIRYYRLSANRGNSEAMVALGVRYMKGVGGLAKDPGEALQLFRAAAEAGSHRAVCYITLGYEKGWWKDGDFPGLAEIVRDAKKREEGLGVCATIQASTASMGSSTRGRGGAGAFVRQPAKQKHKARYDSCCWPFCCPPSG